METWHLREKEVCVKNVVGKEEGKHKMQSRGGSEVNSDLNGRYNPSQNLAKKFQISSLEIGFCRSKRENFIHVVH